MHQYSGADPAFRSRVGVVTEKSGGSVFFVGHKTDFIFHVLSFPGGLLFNENVVFILQ